MASNRKHPGPYRELDSVDQVRSEIIPEEFPEGSYGASTNEAKLGKTSPWKSGQRTKSHFIYEDKEFHEGLQRKFPGSHPTHDEKSE